MTSPIKKFNGAKLRQLRNKAKLTQNELAAKMGMGNKSGSAIGPWENNKVPPNEKNVAKLAEIFSVTVDSLYKEVTPKVNSAKKPQGSIDPSQAQGSGNAMLITRKLADQLVMPNTELKYVGHTSEGHIILEAPFGGLYKAVPLSES